MSGKTIGNMYNYTQVPFIFNQYIRIPLQPNE